MTFLFTFTGFLLFIIIGNETNKHNFNGTLYFYSNLTESIM